MAKNFRFYDAANVQGWDDSQPYNDLAISSIEDPDGASAEREITSIPSPFARIDLVKNAFKEVSDDNLEGNTIYHKMVSDALDIGEILFNYSKYETEIDIITWDPLTDLNKLVNSNDDSHKLLGETLRLYLSQDSKGNNFADIKKIYLLHYKNGPDQLNIIGGTSSASLFFTSANKYDLKGFHSGRDKFFDDSYNPLYKRDKEYIKYLFSLRRQFSQFANTFGTFNEYLDRTYTYLKDEIKAEVNDNTAYYDDLQNLTIDGSGQVIEVLGINLKMAPDKSDNIQNTSDFRIDAIKNKDSIPKLILPVDTITGDFHYVSDNWDNNKSAPFNDPLPFEQRTLPFDGSKYPYLTISDFFEPYIVRTEFKIDDNYFYTGNYTGAKGYLLPLKPLFFVFFPAEFLTKTLNGERVFELKALNPTGVQVFLRIPIQNGKTITYTRKYHNLVDNLNIPKTNEEQNKGYIIENRINVGITPFYKFPDYVEPEYNIAFYDADAENPLFENLEYEFGFYDDNNNLIGNVLGSKRRFKNEENIDMISQIINSNFEYFQIKNDFAQGILIPRLKSVGRGAKNFSFAIDFGTTNTHIEYRESGNIPQAFEFQPIDKNHLGSLIDSTEFKEPYLGLVEQDLLPLVISQNEKYNFPQRTVIASHNKVNFQRRISSYSEMSIPFYYEKDSYATNIDIHSNIKWGSGANSKEILGVFFEQLVKMIRNKVLLNNGDLDKTEIVWTYPASMLTFQVNNMEKEWETLINKYLGSQVKRSRTWESLPPFYYYSKLQGKEAVSKPFVTIDIGGGTSDIAIFENEKPVLFTSYRFAADSIFGDNYNRSIQMNAYVKKYLPKILTLLTENDVLELINVVGNIKNRNNSNDAINAFFSLDSNNLLKDKKIEISFLKLLIEDRELKIIFLLFYIAQVYHLAKIIYKKGLNVPSEIAFSGTASKLLLIIDESKEKRLLKEISSIVFNHVFCDNKLNINISLAENPKELTSKGCLYMDDSYNLEDIKEVLLTNDKLYSEEKIKFSKISEIEKISLKEYHEFLDFFFKLNDDFSFKDKFGIEKPTLDASKVLLYNKSESALKVGIKQKERELDDEDEQITETLFFYPLVGSLGELATELIKDA